VTDLLRLFDTGIDRLILAYFLLINTFYFLFNILSLTGILRYRRLVTFVRFGELFRMPIVKPVSVIVPAYNEAQGIIDSVRSLLSLRYPVFEVIVVNDGSTDDTLDRLVEAFELKPSKFVFRKSLATQPLRGIYRSALHPKLVVVDKVNGKKADAMNAGLNISRYPLFCAVDADSVLEKDALLKVVRPFLEDPERTIGAGGIIRLSNGCEVHNGQVVQVGLPRNWIARFQILEYLRAFLGGRMGMAMMRSTLIISGAFGIFRKDIAMACQGYRTISITEDMDLVIRMQKLMHERKKPYRIQFIPDPICWTEAPEKMRVLARQRSRWHRGLIQTLVTYRRMLFNPRYGIAGMFAMPFYALFEMAGPFIECLGYAVFLTHIVFGRVDYPFAVAFFFVAVFYGTFVSLLAIFLEEMSSHRYPRLRDILILSVSGLAENLFYRQYLAVVRARAYLDYLRGKADWGAMEKKGFAKAEQTS
jgi:cellulose synthase/poly-beta-1,6-N-acetylglucosamine synthase-like glycosyltransferase